MYRVLCGGCNREVDEEYYAWTDDATAISVALESDWAEYKGEYYCWNCMSYDEVEDEYIPTSLFEYRAALYADLTQLTDNPLVEDLTPFTKP